MIHERPSLQHPNGFRVAVGHAPIDGAAEPVEVFHFAAGWGHFDECIGCVQVVGAEAFCLLLHQQPGDPGEQWIERIEQGRLPLDPAYVVQLGVGELLCQGDRYMAGKALQHGRHAQFALPGEDPLLQFLMPLDPAVRQWSAPALQTAHPLKRQERRPGQELGNLLIAEAQPPAYGLPYRLLARDRKRHIHAAQGHPVDQFLPLVPVVPGQRIPERAIVEEVPVSRPTHPSHLGGCFRQRVRQGQLPSVQRHVAMAIVVQVPVQARGHRAGRVTAYHHAPVARLEFEHVAAVRRRDRLEREATGMVGQQTFQQCSGGVGRLRRRVFRRL